MFLRLSKLKKVEGEVDLNIPMKIEPTVLICTPTFVETVLATVPVSFFSEKNWPGAWFGMFELAFLWNLRLQHQN